MVKNNISPSRQRKPAPELSDLELFVGTWKTEGINFPLSPGGNEERVAGRDHYEWLDGGFFLIGKWEHLFLGGGHGGISLLGFDESTRQFFSRNFDNLGYERRYLLEHSEHHWKFVGVTERAERIFSADGNSYAESWEIKNEDDEWVPLCEMRGYRIIG